METIHATCIAVDGAGVLLRGPPGAGKSDLALRLIDRGAVLVADDRVRLDRRDGLLVASAPERIAGRLEVRGIGILAFPAAAEAVLRLVIDLVPPESVPRLPEPATVTLAGVALPCLALAPFEASAPLKLLLALRSAGADSAGFPQPSCARR